jgi:hypothetical protein
VAGKPYGNFLLPVDSNRNDNFIAHYGAAGANAKTLCDGNGITAYFTGG